MLHIVRYLWLGKVQTWHKLALQKSCTISANAFFVLLFLFLILSGLGFPFKKNLVSQPLKLQLEILPPKDVHQGPSWRKPCMSSANVASSTSRSWPQKSATMVLTGSAHAHEAFAPIRCFFGEWFDLKGQGGLPWKRSILWLSKLGFSYVSYASYVSSNCLLLPWVFIWHRFMGFFMENSWSVCGFGLDDFNSEKQPMVSFGTKSRTLTVAP